MNALGMQGAFLVPRNLPLIGAVTLCRQNWLYPAFMVVIGAYYLPFIFSCGMWQFGVLAASLIGAGVAIALYVPAVFSLWGVVDCASAFALCVRWTKCRHSGTAFRHLETTLWSLAGIIQVGFGEDGIWGGLEVGAGGCGEHGAACLYDWREGGEADGCGQIVIDGFHAAMAKIGFVPEAGASGIAQEILPPLAVRVGAGPFNQGIGIAPVLAHADVHREKREEEIFVAQEAFGFFGGRLADLRGNAEQHFESGQTIDAHSKIDDDEVGIGRQIDG